MWAGRDFKHLLPNRYFLLAPISFFNNRVGTEVVGPGPGGIWGRVQGVGSDHWGTRSQP